ncbi:MAG TPA: DUF1517 domain-containing protein [Polyangia bacterium]|nr:DUF1517 domain-containing protein [Polyangia bacterium]
MKILRRALSFLLLLVALTAALGGPALAGPRSGSSFGGRLGFRSGGGMSAPSYSGGGYRSPGYGSGYGYGGGSHFFFFPGFGGYGLGGFGMIGPLLGMVVVGLAVVSIARAVRASRGMSAPDAGYGDDGQVVAMPGRAYLYRLQLALGRSARGIQDRLADFAAHGDTSTEAGLAALLQQTALELLREKDAVRYVGGDARGPMSLTNAETAMNGIALGERSRFQVERVRGTDGRVVRSDAPAEEGKEALELVVVTLLVATRTPLSNFDRPSSSEQLAGVLSELGGVPPDAILGLEVIWTPADPNDSMTETDVMTTYPDLRSL